MKNVLFFLMCAAAVCWGNTADFNSDHQVNLHDFSVFRQAWHARAGDVRYNDLCDLAAPKNGVIDCNDLLVLADNWLWQAIRLDIYSDGWGHYCDTVWVDGEGTWTIRFSDSHEALDYQGMYYAYLLHRGDFTEMASFQAARVSPPWQDPVWQAVVEADIDPINPELFNGTIFLTQPFFKDAYLANTEVDVLDPQTMEPVVRFTTDAQGRFSTGLDEGFYLFSFPEGSEQHVEEAFVSGTYQDFLYPSFVILLKPNIYLYPPAAMEAAVSLEFPAGGRVTVSDPAYGSGWQVHVTPEGVIDGTYSYLFYESAQPDYCQYEAGWVVAGEDLEAFFRANLAQTGFIAGEIEDFVEYWMPRLSGPYYAIYPQYNDELDSMVRLNLSPSPDSVIRLIYCVRQLPDGGLELPTPRIPAFSREGFTVAEWGVMLK